MSPTRSTRKGATASPGALRLPAVGSVLIRRTREELGMTRAVFADRLGIKRRTLERWEQGRSRPGHEASALILLVRAFRDTLDRLAALQTAGRRRARTGHAGQRGGSEPPAGRAARTKTT